MEDWTSSFTLKFPDNWFRSPTLRVIQLYGVQVIDIGLQYVKFEGIVFDDISKIKFAGIYLENNEFNCTEIEPIVEFNIISDTCIQFKLNRVISPEVYDFKLLTWD